MNNNTDTLSKILTGINNTLNIANKTIPIIKETKPIINGAKETLNNFKSTGNDIKKMYKLLKLKNQIKKDTKNISITKPTNIKYTNTNNPKFFI